MLGDRKHGIFGTTGGESAVRPDERTDEVTIGANQEEEDAFHEDPYQGSVLNESSSALSFFSINMPRTGAIILTTQSLPCSRSCCDLNHSLRIRLSLLRSTALDKSRLGTISPSRAGLGSVDLMITFAKRPRTDRPSFMASVKSAPLREPRKGFASREPNKLSIRFRRQTARRARPLARRARITARPPLVFIRSRKPCVRFRRTTEGW